MNETSIDWTCNSGRGQQAPPPRDISTIVLCSCGTFIRLFTSFITSPLLASEPATRVMAAGH